MDPQSAIDNILQTLHHPFNAKQSSVIQMQMFAAVKQWWFSKSTDHQERIHTLLSKEAIQENRNHLNEGDPIQFGGLRGPAKFDGSAPETAEPPKTIGEQLAEGLSKVIAGDPTAVLDLLGAKPTAENPNPIDRALSQVGQDIVKTFENVPIQAVKAAANMGNIAKEAIINTLEEARRPIDNAVSAITGPISSTVEDVGRFFSRSWW